MDRLIDGPVDHEWINGWMDGWMDGWMKVQTDRHQKSTSCVPDSRPGSLWTWTSFNFHNNLMELQVQGL